MTAALALAAALLPAICWTRQAAAQNADVAKGKELYVKLRCSICHSIEGKGGRVAGPLDSVGKKYTPDKMFAFLRAPSSVNPASAMPPTRGTPDEIRAVAAYMLSLGGQPAVVDPEPSIALGQQVFASRDCFYCHKIGPRGGRLSAALDTLPAERRRRDRVVETLKHPAGSAMGFVMPQIPMKEYEVQSLAFYIESLQPGAPAPPIVLPSPAEGGTEPSMAEGEALYWAATCKSCHAIDGKGGYLGPSLDNQGGAGRKGAALLSFFQKPDEVSPGTLMPPVQGTERQLKSLALYLESLKKEIKPTVSLGQQVYVQRNCGYCHSPDGKGGKDAKPLTGTPDRTDAWLLEHFKNPAAVTPDSVMPGIRAADWEFQALLEHVKSIKKAGK